MKAAVKFCGGCNPGYDRTEYWAGIREASVGRIEWVPLDSDGLGAILLICGCERACPRDDLSRQSCLVSVTNSSLPAAAVVSLLEACSERISQEFEDPVRKERSDEGDQDCRRLCPKSERTATSCVL